jgi:thiol-disulfide isomerase/thioredoxin
MRINPAAGGWFDLSLGEKRRTVIAAALLAIFLCAPRPATVAPIPPAAASQPAHNLTILFFTAAWCEPCHAVESILQKFARKHSGEVRLVAIDFDHSPEEVARWEIRQIPVVILISPQDKVLLRAEGAGRETLKSLPSALEETLKRARKELSA